MRLLSMVTALALLSACGGGPGHPPSGVGAPDDGGEGACVPYSTLPELDAWLAEHADDYAAAIERARGWLDRLPLDPNELPASVKPKKKLVELLDSYLRLQRVGIDDARLRARLAQLAATTDDPRYHDMLEVDDTTFKQNSTSYLRAAYLLDRLGVPTGRYRQEIDRVHPRLNGHMPQRGPHQRAAFHTYYTHFGLDEPFPLAVALERGLIAERKDPRTMDRWGAYGLTHEIFVPYDYGDDLDADPFDDADLRYVRSALAHLTDHYIEAGDPDLVAELVSCMRYVRATDLPQYVRGLEMLFASQHRDGHWGDYERARARHGDLVAVKYELHTTAVAVDALTVAFHPGWNEGVAPRVPPGR